MRINIKHVICFILTAVITCCAIAVPKRLLNYNAGRDINEVKLAPEDYYLASGTAIARNASSQLSSLERVKLIYGSWESNMSQCSITEGFLSEAEAVNLAKTQLDIYYENKISPISINSSFSNWYSWDSELYKYTDSMFNTYTAYMWKLTFTKYNNSDYVTIYMTETGMLLAAESNRIIAYPGKISETYMNRTVELLGSDNAQYTNVTLRSDASSGTDEELTDSMKDRIYSFIDTTDIHPINVYTIELSDSKNSFDTYYLYQYASEDKNGFCIVPE